MMIVIGIAVILLVLLILVILLIIFIILILVLVLVLILLLLLLLLLNQTLGEGVVKLRILVIRVAAHSVTIRGQRLLIFLLIIFKLLNIADNLNTVKTAERSAFEQNILFHGIASFKL